MNDDKPVRIELNFLEADLAHEDVANLVNLLDNTTEVKTNIIRKYLHKGLDRLKDICTSKNITIEEGVIKLILDENFDMDFSLTKRQNIAIESSAETAITTESVNTVAVENSSETANLAANIDTVVVENSTETTIAVESVNIVVEENSSETTNVAENIDTVAVENSVETETTVENTDSVVIESNVDEEDWSAFSSLAGK